jgi:hypothetical protein
VIAGRLVVPIVGLIVLALAGAGAAKLAHRPQPPPPSAPLPPSVPEGWRRMRDRDVTAELRARAVEILGTHLVVGSFVPIDPEHAGLVEVHRNGREHRGVSLLVKG